MYRWGHVGAALCCWGPVAAVAVWAGYPMLALVGTAVAVAISTLPDADEFDAVPFAHRGFTHTVWFLLVGATAGACLGAVVGAAVGRPGGLAAAVGAASAVSLGSHLLADSITPMGIKPLYPLSTWHHSFDLTPAKNPRANAALLVGGGLLAVSCLVAASL